MRLLLSLSLLATLSISCAHYGKKGCCKGEKTAECKEKCKSKKECCKKKEAQTKDA